MQASYNGLIVKVFLKLLDTGDIKRFYKYKNKFLDSCHLYNQKSKRLNFLKSQSKDI